MNKFLLNISAIIIISMLTKIIAFFFLSDINLDNEWGMLVHNLSVTGTYGLNVLQENGDYAIHSFANIGDKVLPSIFMPPLYAYFIFLINIFVEETSNLTKVTILIQIFLSLISINIFYKILKNYFTKYISLLLTFIFAFLPINIYSPLQISSITLQIFLLMFYFLYVSNIIEKKRLSDIILFSIISGFLILTRGEFIFFFLLTLIYIIYQKRINIKKFLIILFFIFATCSPYIIRNYLIFDNFILTKSTGFNLLKGNNPLSKVEGNTSFIDQKYDPKKLLIKTDIKYELYLDNFYKDEAIKYIKEDPIRYLKLYAFKFFSFMFMDFNSSYPNYYNIFHILPKIILAILSFLGAFYALKKKNFFQFCSIFYFSHFFLFSFFFILPRYSIILIPIQLFLIVNYILKKN